MKKVISILLSVVLVLSLFIGAYADPDHGKDANKSGTSSLTKKPVAGNTTSSAAIQAKTLEELLAQLKTMQVNDDLKKKLVKLIVDYRKKKGDSTMPVFLNGTLVKLDSSPVVKGFTVYLPAKSILTAAATSVVDGDSQMIVVIATTAPNPSTTYLVLDKKSGKLYKNGNEIKTGLSLSKINGKLYINADFFAKVLEMKVDFDKTNGALLLYTKGYVPAPSPTPTPAPTTTPAPTQTPAPTTTPEPTPAPTPTPTPTPTPAPAT